MNGTLTVGYCCILIYPASLMSMNTVTATNSASPKQMPIHVSTIDHNKQIFLGKVRAPKDKEFTIEQLAPFTDTQMPLAGTAIARIVKRELDHLHPAQPFEETDRPEHQFAGFKITNTTTQEALLLKLYFCTHSKQYCAHLCKDNHEILRQATIDLSSYRHSTSIAHNLTLAPDLQKSNLVIELTKIEVPDSPPHTPNLERLWKKLTHRHNKENTVYNSSPPKT